jgi:magnesium transporter
MAPAYPQDRIESDELWHVWPVLAARERAEAFQLLAPDEADAFFLNLRPLDQSQIVAGLPTGQRRIWMRVLAPDDAADLLQEVDVEQRQALIDLLDETTRREVSALLAYAEDDAGGLMNPRFARVRPDMTVDEAIAYLRKQARGRLETIYYIYVLDTEQKLLGVVSFRELFGASVNKLVREIMHTDVISVRDDMDQEVVAKPFLQHGFLAIPVLDADGRMKGIVTIDDIVDVVEEEATEDVQKFGGMEALDSPYMQTSALSMIKKRAGWLAVLFIGEMLTASAMATYEDEIKRAVVLALFIPLIISSGGNSGSQAATLVIRAMALGEVRLGDWYRIVHRELTAGAALGAILAAIGVVRILLWHAFFGAYGDNYAAVAATVGLSLIGVVLCGTISGSMLPFVIRRLGFDPASASAPFVATLVDVSGLVIYFTTASIVMGGSLL